MTLENALVIYKNKPALVKEKTGEKYIISLDDGSLVKVRDKDVELIHPGPVKSFTEIYNTDTKTVDLINEAWELLVEDNGSPLTLKDLAVFIFSGYTPSSAYAAYLSLTDGVYFSGGASAIVPRSAEEVRLEKTRRLEKSRETGERAAFLERLKACLKKPSDNPLLPGDTRFIQDIEALAYGKSAKSRAMKEIGFEESPEEAHALLLKTGFWTDKINPHPERFGLSLNSANIRPCPPAPETRVDLRHLAAFAIDSPWSGDPDDAISIETNGKDSVLYAHIADPVSSITADSPAHMEARDRGATLYLPEKTVRMLAEEALPMFALGLSEESPALTFKLTIDAESREIKKTEIFPSIVKVRRLTYEEADREMEADSPDAGALRALRALADSNLKRRTDMGAVNIELPEVHISVKNGSVNIQPFVFYHSVGVVRECMILAGEGAAAWAAANNIPFPYISQEAELPKTRLAGLAGSVQTRRCMRPRVLSTKPGRHQGHGLDIYTQVTSPLRRYTDLLAHSQIRAFIKGGALLSADEVINRLGAGEAAAIAATQAERASNNHWTLVYLSEKKDAVWEAVALEKKGNRWAFLIPSLAFETQAALVNDVSPNDIVKLVLKSVNIPRTEAVFTQEKS